MEQWDVWTTKEVVFPNLEAGRVALQDNELLDPFFGAWIDTLDRIDAAPSISSSTALARKMPAFGVNVLMIGEAGAGKSTLVKVMTGDEDIITSATHAGTYGDTVYKCPCKINWVDTPGFKLPVSPEDATLRGQSTLMRWKDDFAWSRKRLLEMWSIPQRYAVPLIVCLTDVCGVDDSALKEVRKTMGDLVTSLGPDAVNRHATLIEINSEQKTIRGHQYKVTGVKQLLEAVINALHPQHSLQLLTRPWFGGSTKHSSHRHLPIPDAGDAGGARSKGEKRASERGGGVGGSPQKKSRSSSS